MIAKRYLAYAAIFLFALALRLYGIGSQSLWYDEGLTAALVQRPPGEIVRRAAADVHPPLFYLLLSAWAAVFGTGEAALRSFSALCGALAALLTAVLGRRWFGGSAGLIAGVAAAVSPLAVYYGQEARMYALAALLAVLLWLAMDLWRTSGARRWLLLYALAALAGLLAHYFFVTVVAAAGLAGLLAPAVGEHGAPWRSSFVASFLRGAKRTWLGLHLLLAAAFLPLVWNSRSTLSGWGTSGDTPGAALVLLDALRAMALGPVAPLAAMQWLPLFALLLSGVALWPAAVRPWPRAMAAAWLLVPVAALALLSLGQPYYKPRFLLPALPAFHLLLGAGAVALAARVGTRGHEGTKFWFGFVPSCLRGFTLLLVLAAAEPLLHTYFDPLARRDDYRGLAQAITATARPGDAVLLTGPGQVEPLDYYLKLPLARYPLPRTRPLDPAATEADLAALARDHQRVYGVFYVPEGADPQRVITGWLVRNAFRAPGVWYGGVQLVVYEFGEPPATVRSFDARFAGGLRLLDARVDAGPLRPGDAVRAELRWQADAPLPPLLVFAHLLDAEGRLVAQYDGPLAAAGTETWQPGAPYRSRLAILVPAETPPGTYRLVLGVYTPDRTRLALPDGADTLVLTAVQVE